MKLTPIRVYLITWSSVLLIYFTELSPLFPVRLAETKTFILFAILPIALLLVIARFSPLKNTSKVESKLRITKYKTYWIIFVLSTIFELILFKNIPLLGVIGLGPYIDYTDYGIGGLHGLVNALHITLMTLSYILYNKTQKKRYLIYILLLFSWAVCLFSRQLMISLLVYLFFAYIFLRNRGVFSLRDIVMYTTPILIILIGFTQLGALRSGNGGLMGALGLNDTSMVGVIKGWLYSYLVSPLYNLLNNLDGHTAIGLPVNTLISLFPSFVREMLSDFAMKDFYLEHAMFNVSTAFPAFLVDFGLLGLFIFPAIIGVFSLRIQNYRSKTNISTYVFLCHGAIFSFFGNFILSLPFLAALALMIMSIKKERAQ